MNKNNFYYLENFTTFEDSFKGETGSDGIKGEIGQPGNVGLKGLNGKIGFDGIQGPRGVMGDRGNKGDIGEPGNRGKPGAMGIKGIKGIKGVIGDKGQKGDNGERGFKGSKGIKGEQGKNGATGAKGESGSSYSKLKFDFNNSDWNCTNWRTVPQITNKDNKLENVHKCPNNGVIIGLRSNKIQHVKFETFYYVRDCGWGGHKCWFGGKGDRYYKYNPKLDAFQKNRTYDICCANLPTQQSNPDRIDQHFIDKNGGNKILSLNKYKFHPPD